MENTWMISKDLAQVSDIFYSSNTSYSVAPGMNLSLGSELSTSSLFFAYFYQFYGLHSHLILGI